MRVEIRYGSDGRLELELPSQQVAGVCSKPGRGSLPDPARSLSEWLDRPLDFPPLDRAVVPGDRVVIVLDDELPLAAQLTAPIVQRLVEARVRPRDIALLGARPAANADSAADPRQALPDEWREPVRWELHDPSQKDRLSYLANTASGHRIYLNRRLVDADLVVAVARLGRDSTFANRSLAEVLYPAMSDPLSQQRGRRLAVAAIGREDGTTGLPRAAARKQGRAGGVCRMEVLAEEAEEVAWLLGIQFAVGVVPGWNHGVADVLAGEMASVAQRGKALVAATWRFSVGERADVVVTGVEGAGPTQTLASLGAALAAARQVVQRDGKVVVLTGICGEAGPGVQMLAGAHDPGEAMRRLEREAPPDAVAAAQIAATVSWAHVYLLSALPARLVEDLSIRPLDSAAEVAGLVAGEGSCVFLNQAQRVLPAVERA